MTTHSLRCALLIVLSVQLCAADALRWRRTTATIQSPFEYLLGQEVIASENWRREGALARHFVPSRSIDQTLPEWPYRDTYWRDYLSQPPLAFMLAHLANRSFDRFDPVVVGKVLAQLQIAVAVLVSAAWLFDVFGFGAALAGLTFFIWGRPFLVWYIDGYYSTTTALLCQLLFVSWCLRFFVQSVALNSWSPVRRTDLSVAAVLAYLGTMSEWIALFGNGVAVIAFTIIAVLMMTAHRWSQAKHAFLFASTVAVSSAAAVLSTVLLYGTKVGVGFFWRQLMSRVQERTGEGAFLPYMNVLVTQMKTAWPSPMLVVLAAMAVAVVIYAALGQRTVDADHSILLILTLVLGFGSAATYCYRLKDLVAIHWWFIGTWTMGWVMTICAFASVTWLALRRLSDTTRTVAYTAVCIALLTPAIGCNLRFVDLAEPKGAIIDGALNMLSPAGNAGCEIYRVLGQALPRDHAPLIVVDMPDLFDNYPFPTAYLRRPVVRFASSGALLKMGTTEDARSALADRGGFAYVAFDPSMRQCNYPDVTAHQWRLIAPMAICQVPVSVLTGDAARIFRALSDAPTHALTDWVSALLSSPICCRDPQSLLSVARLLDSRLRLRSGDAVEAVRHENAERLHDFIGMWQRLFGRSSSGADPSLLGILSEHDRWYLLLANVGGQRLPAFDSGVRVSVNGKTLQIVAPYQGTTMDGRGVLPFSMIEARPLRDVADRDLTIALDDAHSAVVRPARATVIRSPDSIAMSEPARDALLSLSTGCLGPPAPPMDLQLASNSRDSITLTWSGSSGVPMSYVLDAGLAPGRADVVANADLGNAATTFTAMNVRPGTYYLRVRAKNGCATGTTSNEVAAVVR